MKILAQLILFVLMLSISLKAQLPDYHVKLIAEQQGMHTADLRNIAKDATGFLWLTTQTSVRRFDGRKSTVFKFKETVFELFIDSRDRKWVRTKDGIYRFKNDFVGFELVLDRHESDSSVKGFFVWKRKLYVLLPSGAMVYDESLGKFIPENQLIKGFDNSLLEIISPVENTLLLRSRDSVFCINLALGTKRSIAINFANCIIGLNESEALVSDWDAKSYHLDFKELSAKEISIEAISKNLYSDFVRFNGGILFNENTCLISSNQGLLEYNIRTKKYKKPVFYYKGKPIENSQSVFSFNKDDAGIVYFTHADGIIYLDPNKQNVQYLRNYSDGITVFPDFDLRSFTETDDGGIWIASANGLIKMELPSGRLGVFLADGNKKGINFPSIRYVLNYEQKLFVGTGGKGLFISTDEGKSFIRPKYTNNEDGRNLAQKLNEDFIWKILPISEGSLLIAGGESTYLLDSKTLMAHSIYLPTSGAARSAIKDAKGNLWYGSTQGLYCFDDSFNLNFTIIDSFTDLRIASLLELADGQIFIGSKGLYEARIVDKKLTYFQRVNEIPVERFIYCMEKDKYGRVWLGTDEGLISFDPLSGKTTFFDETDNFQNQAFNSNGLYYASSGIMYAGGKAGMNYFIPEKLVKNEQAIFPIVSLFKVGSNDSLFYEGKKEINLNYNQRNIYIEISAPEYQNPYEMQFKYALEGSEKSTWLYNGNSNIVNLDRLLPGNYSVRIAASHDGKTWFESKDAIKFRIANPWWAQWYSFLIYLCLIGLVIKAIMHYRKLKRIDEDYRKAVDYFANSGDEHSGVNDILWDITRNCISRLDFEECVIYLVDHESQVLVQKAAYGAKSPMNFEIINPIKIKIGQAIVGSVAANGVAEIVPDTTKDPRYLVDDEMRYSEIAVPIVHGGKVIGVIDSEHSRKNFFNKKHMRTLQSIASICSAKISRGVALDEMHKAEIDLSDLNKKMLETKFLNLRLQMNPHFLFNSLSSIQHLIVTGQTHEAYKYLSIFSNFLRSVLQFADKTLITLDEEINIIKMYINLESLGFDKSFNYDIFIDDKLECEDILVPPLIIQPFIENAIWHGLLHKEGEKYFSVNFMNGDEERLICDIVDNGVGRKKAASNKAGNLTAKIYESKSTKLIQERLELLTQKTGKKACITIEDNLNGELCDGTKVQLIIPFYNDDEK